MLKTKEFLLEDNQGKDNKILTEILEGEMYSLHMGVERGKENYTKGITIGQMTEETVEEIVNFLETFLMQRTDASLSKEFDKVMYMGDEPLHDDPQWKKKGKFRLGLHEKNGNFSMRLNALPYGHKGATLGINLGSQKDVLEELIQLLRDNLKRPLNLDKPEDIPDKISEAESRLDIAIQKFYMGNKKEAASEAREAFHVLKKEQAWLKEELSEKKVGNLVGSRKKLASMGLHEEERGEKLTEEDTELVLRDISNMLRYINESL